MTRSGGSSQALIGTLAREPGLVFRSQLSGSPALDLFPFSATFSCPAMPPPITVLIADDHAILREGLRVLLQFEDGFEVVAEASDGEQAVDLAIKYRPDVVVMDIGMPVLDGVAATRKIREALPDTNVLIVSAQNYDTYIQQSMAAGALGFISKHTCLTNVPLAVREIAAGNTFIGLAPPKAVRLAGK
jgi:DNA-binding NarL/FixJ family response regulator